MLTKLAILAVLILGILLAVYLREKSEALWQRDESMTILLKGQL